MVLALLYHWSVHKRIIKIKIKSFRIPIYFPIIIYVENIVSQLINIEKITITSLFKVFLSIVRVGLYYLDNLFEIVHQNLSLRIELRIYCIFEKQVLNVDIKKFYCTHCASWYPSPINFSKFTAFIWLKFCSVEFRGKLNMWFRRLCKS